MELDGSTWGPAQPDHSTEKIVFLHGMGGAGKLWRPIAAALEEQFKIFAPDQRGHGKSRHLPESANSATLTFTPLDYGLDLVETLGSLGFHPTWVVGHSMGVRTACAFAHLRPEWTRGLVLIDLGFAGPAGGGLGEGLARFLRKLPTRFPTRAEARDFMAQECPDISIAQYLMAVSELDIASGELCFPFDRAALIATIDAAQNSSVRPWVYDLGARNLPILVLRGKNSLVWTHEQFEEERALFADHPSIQFREIEGAGHGLPFEKRPEFIAILLEFFTQCATR